MIIFRPILEQVISYTEVRTMLSLNDLIKINDLLDMKNDLTRQHQEQKA